MGGFITTNNGESVTGDSESRGLWSDPPQGPRNVSLPRTLDEVKWVGNHRILSLDTVKPGDGVKIVKDN